MPSAHAMGAHERGGQGRLRYQNLETVQENDELELPLDWWSKPQHARVASAHKPQPTISPTRDITSQSGSSKTSGPAKTTPRAEQPRIDDRPVRGVATIQALPSHAAGAKSVLLVVRRGTLSMQTLQKPYRQLLELPLGDVAARVVPGHENMFRVTIIGSNPDAAGLLSMVVVLSDCSLRDRWLQALVTAGARVDLAGSCLTASTGKTSYPDAPVRWLR